MKSITTYWNPLAGKNSSAWEEIEGSNGNLYELLTPSYRLE